MDAERSVGVDCTNPSLKPGLFESPAAAYDRDILLPNVIRELCVEHFPSRLGLPNTSRLILYKPGVEIERIVVAFQKRPPLILNSEVMVPLFFFFFCPFGRRSGDPDGSDPMSRDAPKQRPIKRTALL